MDAVHALRQAFLFRNLPDPVLELVAQTAEEIAIPPGEVLLSPLDDADSLYVIRSGTLSMVPAEDARPVLFGTGETIGEAPFVDHEPAGVTVLALERAELIVIRATKLADALAAHPEAGFAFYRALAGSLAGRLRRAAGMLVVHPDRCAPVT